MGLDEFVNDVVIFLVKSAMLCLLIFVVKRNSPFVKRSIHKTPLKPNKMYRLYKPSEEGKTVGYFTTLDELLEEALLHHVFTSNSNGISKLKSFKSKDYLIEVISIMSSDFYLNATKEKYVKLDNCFPEGISSTSVYKSVLEGLKDKSYLLGMSVKYVSGITLSKDEKKKIVDAIQKLGI